MDDEIKAAMALAFFASAWADAAEEAGESLRGEIMDQVPSEIDPAALRAADKLAAGMVRENGGRSLAALLEAAQGLIAKRGGGDREPTPEMFGYYAAMQAMGTGVGLGDAFGSAVYQAIRVPYQEFASCYLERDYFDREDSDDE